MVSSMDALNRRMRDSLKPKTNLMDSRSTPGRISRGDNVYNGGTPSSGGNQWGGSSTAINSGGSGTRSMLPVDNGNLGAINMQPTSPSGGSGGGTPQPTTPTFGQPETDPMDEFDAIYEKRLNDIMAQQAQLNSRREQALRSLDQKKAFSQDALKRMFDKNLDRNEINMADRGLYRSGINIREQGDIGEDYQNTEAQNLAQFASQREGIEQQFGQADSQIQNFISQLQTERALRAEDVARERARREAENKALQPVLGPDGRYQPGPGIDPQVTDYMQQAGIGQDYVHNGSESFEALARRLSGELQSGTGRSWDEIQSDLDWVGENQVQPQRASQTRSMYGGSRDTSQGLAFNPGNVTAPEIDMEALFNPPESVTNGPTRQGWYRWSDPRTGETWNVPYGVKPPDLHGLSRADYTASALGRVPEGWTKEQAETRWNPDLDSSQRYRPDYTALKRRLGV